MACQLSRNRSSCGKPFRSRIGRAGTAEKAYINRLYGANTGVIHQLAIEAQPRTTAQVYQQHAQHEGQQHVEDDETGTEEIHRGSGSDAPGTIPGNMGPDGRWTILRQILLSDGARRPVRHLGDSRLSVRVARRQWP